MRKLASVQIIANMADCLASLNQIESAATKLELVPFINSFVLPNDSDAIVNLAIGTSVLNPTAQREGLVFRPLNQEVWDADFGRVSFKAINPEFLLRYEE